MAGLGDTVKLEELSNDEICNLIDRLNSLNHDSSAQIDILNEELYRRQDEEDL